MDTTFTVDYMFVHSCSKFHIFAEYLAGAVSNNDNIVFFASVVEYSSKNVRIKYLRNIYTIHYINQIFKGEC